MANDLTFGLLTVPLAGRGARTDEAIALIRRLWTSDEITYEGRFHRMGPVRIHPPPLQPHPPSEETACCPPTRN